MKRIAEGDDLGILAEWLLKSRREFVIQLREEVSRNALLLGKRGPDLAVGVFPHVQEFAAHCYSSPRNAITCNALNSSFDVESATRWVARTHSTPSIRSANSC